MKNFKKTIALLLAVCMLVSLFTACSKKAGKVEAIKKAGKFVMLTNAAFAPFEYLGADNKPAGVDVDIAQAIADELGVTLEVVDMDFDGIIPAVQSGQGDIGAAGITANDERRLSVDFSINYVDTAQMIIVSENSEIKSSADLAGKTIGTQMGTTGEIYVSDEVENANVQRFKTGPDAGLALQNGQLDAVVIDAMPAAQIAQAGTGLKVLEEPLTTEQYAIAISKDNADLKEVIDKVLQKMIDDGSLAAALEKHQALSAGN